MRETTQSSEKKVYGPYTGYIEKLKKPIELKGRVIRYKPVAKLLKNKKMKGGGLKYTRFMWDPYTSNKPKLKKDLEEKLNGLYTPYRNDNKNIDPSEKLFITEDFIQIAKNYPDFEETKKKIIQALKELDINVEVIDREVINIHHFKFDIKGKTENQLKELKRELEKIFSKGNNGRPKQIYTYLGFNTNHPNRTYKNEVARGKFFIAENEIQIAEDFPDFVNIKAKIIDELKKLGVNFEEVVDT
jgi:type III secretion system FlhB-like substrate exporter